MMVLLAFALSAGLQQSAAQQVTLAIEHASVLPMDRDTVFTDHTILVSGDRIVWIGPSRDARVPRTARRVEARGRFVIPGLADMHVHINDVNELPQFVTAGITTVSQMNGRPEHVVWRNRVNSGALQGPRIYTAGRAISRRPLGRSFGPRRTSEVDAFVRSQKQAGVDFIKVQNGISRPVYDRLLTVARAAGLPVIGHVVEEVGIARALAAGQASFEHAEMPLFAMNEKQIDEGARAIARSGARVGTIVSDRSGKCAPPTALQKRIVSALDRAGVKLLAGDDSGIGPIRAGTGFHCELSTLVAAGLTPYEALSAATRNAGEFARTHFKERVPFGTVTTGSRADLVILASDPRRDIGAVARPVGTVLRGTWLPRRVAGASPLVPAPFVPGT